MENRKLNLKESVSMFVVCLAVCITARYFIGLLFPKSDEDAKRITSMTAAVFAGLNFTKYLDNVQSAKQDTPSEAE